ncbi:D-amino acid dehydrogenase [Oceanibaculum indicum]|uniref:D-amino-acid dehydrogenase n=1 Tax=Oceanibaculum indicum P24 TaxID=1207063 RepID=K2K679_9PROT|nr:D-amino acid dehydrogenase [Oceanibaculum indicum]EKE72955.1 D-amino-acid dehydrogenase [Oceanibaculum indicum P24]
MRIAVLGAGVIGVSTAYELMKDGHEVTVIDRLDEPASETSFANAGLFSPGHAYTWASPKAPKILLKSLFQEGQALRFKPSLDPNLWLWSLKFLQNCTAEKTRINTKRKVRLCMYSQEQLHRIAAETKIEYHGVTGGLLYLYRTPESFARGSANTRILSEEGLELRAITPDEAAKIDPALEPVKHKFAGAIYCPSDESGDARVFTQNLAKYCEAQGVKFVFGSEIQGFDTEGDKVTAVRTSTGRIEADGFVFSLGVFGPRLSKQLGVTLPIYPIKGYSVTMPIGGRNNPPTVGGVDEDNLVAYARFGDRMRVTATAEFAGYNKSHQPSDYTHMLKAVQDIYPDGADYSQPFYWAGLRPMTPEGTPIFGAGRYRNMWFNTGHGHIGWTMAPGSARVTADLIAGKVPALDLTGMRVMP